MAEAALVHPADRFPHRLLSTDGLDIFGHDLAELGRGGVKAGGNDAHQQVALGEDAEHALALHDEHAAAAVLGHAFSGDADSLLRGGADKGRAEAATEDGADGTLRHGGLSLMRVR
jgi:hypothetical protein